MVSGFWVAQRFKRCDPPGRMIGTLVPDVPLSLSLQTKKKIAGAVQAPAIHLMSLPPGLAARDKRIHRPRFVLRPNAEQRRLRLGKLPQFLHLVNDGAFRLVLLALHSALGLVALFLLSRLFLLAFSKS
jgi:hypothetical protein